MRRGQNININRRLEEVESNPRRWLGGAHSSVVVTATADVMETVKKEKRERLEFNVEPEDITELL